MNRSNASDEEKIHFRSFNTHNSKETLRGEIDRNVYIHTTEKETTEKYKQQINYKKNQLPLPAQKQFYLGTTTR